MNELTKKVAHWAYAANLKKAWTLKVMVAAKNFRIPVAFGKRRVDLLVCLGKGRQAVDPDAFWKSSLDALKLNGLIVDDNLLHVEMGTVTYEGRDSGEGWTTYILTEI